MILLLSLNNIICRPLNNFEKNIISGFAKSFVSSMLTFKSTDFPLHNVDNIEYLNEFNSHISNIFLNLEKLEFENVSNFDKLNIFFIFVEKILIHYKFQKNSKQINFKMYKIFNDYVISEDKCYLIGELDTSESFEKTELLLTNFNKDLSNFLYKSELENYATLESGDNFNQGQENIIYYFFKFKPYLDSNLRSKFYSKYSKQILKNNKLVPSIFRYNLQKLLISILKNKFLNEIIFKEYLQTSHFLFPIQHGLISNNKNQNDELNGIYTSILLYLYCDESYNLEIVGDIIFTRMILLNMRYEISGDDRTYVLNQTMPNTDKYKPGCSHWQNKREVTESTFHLYEKTLNNFESLKNFCKNRSNNDDCKKKSKITVYTLTATSGGCLAGAAVGTFIIPFLGTSAGCFTGSLVSGAIALISSVKFVDC